MSKIKTLFSQTLIYGVSTIVVRMLNWLLTPFHTRCFEKESEFGIMSILFAYIALLNIIYMYGMETSFFRFATDKENRTEVFKTINAALLISSSFFSLLIIAFSGPIAQYLNYPQSENLIIIFSLILLFDNISNIPFAFLRMEGRPVKYMTYKLANVCINVFFNLFFLLPAYFHNPNLFEFTGFIYHKEYIVVYVLLANLIASAVTFLFFVPQYIRYTPRFNWTIFRPILNYSMPLVLVGLAGMVNEVASRIFLEKWLTGSPEENLRQVGIFSAVYKLSIFMTLAIQGFKMGAEPFFFKHAKEENAQKLYADVLTYFSIACLIIFLGVNLFSTEIVKILDPKYRAGIGVLPILLFANFCLGIYYNISVWYRLTDRTIYGSLITLIGAAITIALNFMLIPLYGYWGAAWATAIVYFSMCVLCYILGQKYFYVPYQIYKIAGYTVLVFGLTYFHRQMMHYFELGAWSNILVSLIFCAAFIAVAYLVDIKKLLKKN